MKTTTKPGAPAPQAAATPTPSFDPNDLRGSILSMIEGADGPGPSADPDLPDPDLAMPGARQTTPTPATKPRGTIDPDLIPDPVNGRNGNGHAEPEAEVEAEPEAELPEGEAPPAEVLPTEAEQALQASLDAERQRNEDLEARLAKLETATGATPATPPAAGPDFHPAFLANSEAELEQHEAQLDAAEEWAIANWDGYTPENGEGQSVSAQQVRQGFARVRKLRQSVLPKARALLQERAHHEAQARKLYPEVFQKGSKPNQILNYYLARSPRIRADMPDLALVVGAAYAELSRSRAPRPAAAPLKAPRLPGPGASPSSPAARKPASNKGDAPDAKAFLEGGANRDAFVKLFAGG